MKKNRWYLSTAFAVVAFVSAPAAYGSLSFVAQPGGTVFCGTYDVCTSLMPITAADGTTFSTVTDGIVTATLTDALLSQVVGVDWATWNTPPAVESATPNVGQTDGVTETIALSQAVEVLGFELEPEEFTTDTVTVSFFGAGSTFLGDEDLPVNGDGGALLFAADAGSPLITSVTISDATAGNTFAMANFRYAGLGSTSTVPEPASASLLLIGGGLIALGSFARRRFNK
jgi:hypothetical protein